MDPEINAISDGRGECDQVGLGLAAVGRRGPRPHLRRLVHSFGDVTTSVMSDVDLLNEAMSRELPNPEHRILIRINILILMG